MGNTRALFASIGVSVSLVAAAALSLFAVSVVIAFGGWSAGMGGSEPATTLVLAGTRSAPAQAGGARRTDAPVVLDTAAQPQRPRRSTAAAPAPVTSGGTANARVISNPVVATYPTQQALSKPDAVTPPPPAVHIPATGDGVRRVGEDLSSTAHGTGKALADLTAPLGPPVSAAVQKVLDLVAALLRRTTDSLGGTLDKVGG